MKNILLFSQGTLQRCPQKCLKTSWHRLVSAQFLIINMLKMKKVDNFVSNCSSYMVQPFFLEVLMSPMAESFVAVCDMLLKFHNLSAKFVCNFNK